MGYLFRSATACDPSQWQGLKPGEKNKQTLEYTLQERKPKKKGDTEITELMIPLRAPASIKAKAKKNKVIVSWKKITYKDLLKQIKSVEIQYSTDKKFTKNVTTRKIITKTKSKVTLKLQKKTTYYVRVRYKGSNGFSKWSAVKKVTTKK